MKRRAFIAGAAAPTAGERALALSPASRAQFEAALSVEEAAMLTPVAVLFREWTAAKAAEEAAYRASPDDDAAHDAAWEARYEVELRLMAAPGHTAHDFLLKMAAWSNYGEGDPPDAKSQPQVWAEARALIDRPA